MARRSIVPHVAVAAVVLLAACQQDDSSASVPLPAENIERWVMPLDQYSPADSLGIGSYAENLLIQPCMEAAGFSFEVPREDLDTPPRATMNADSGRQLFNLAIAQSYGYHDAPSNLSNIAEILAFYYDTPLTEDAAAQRDTCLESAREQLPLPSAETVNFAATLGSAADEGALADDEVEEAAARWRECMQPVGVSDLPRAPADMPSESLRAQFGLDVLDPTAAPVIGAEELRIAVADAGCRESSGYAETRYRAEWDRQARLVQDNADALVRHQQAWEAYREAALAVVNASAGS
ncbi:hypothetical protein [Cellulomonas hominis]